MDLLTTHSKYSIGQKSVLSQDTDRIRRRQRSSKREMHHNRAIL